MTEIELKGVTMQLRRGDIASQGDMEAVVNAANAQLRIGGGVAGAIHRAAGPGLAEETRSMAPINPGQAVISGAHKLSNDYVIHCLGPVYGRDEPSDKLLADCYRNALSQAEDHGIRSVAFPAISTGAFGYPMKAAARVALRTVLDEMPGLESVRMVRFVLWGEEALAVHEEALREVAGG
ncbi:MAG: macro domain-containing protein [Balneolaceae bacterium]|nr:macro domain-containing protein [Balneolaceae bacterium]